MTTVQDNPYDVAKCFFDAFWDDPGLFAMMVYDMGDHHDYDVDDVVAVIQSNPEWSALLKEGLEEIDEWRAIKNTQLRDDLEKNLTLSLKPESGHAKTSLAQSKTMVGTNSVIQLQQNVLKLVSFVVGGLTANVTNGIKKISNGLQWVKKRLQGAYESMVLKVTPKS